MQLSFTEKKNIRKNFGKLKETLSIPNLIEVQKQSYNQFLSSKKISEANLQKGLNKVFENIFPIEELSEKATLEYLSFRLEKSKFSVEECRQRDLTYSAALKPTLRLVIYDIDQENNTKQILSAKEQEVYMGDIPLMTPSGTFVINGVERVVVNQMHRSPGVFFDHDKGKTHASGKLLFNCRVIPNRGSWLDFEYDVKDILYFRIDRKRKLPVTTLLYALGYKKIEILDLFYDFKTFNFDQKTKKWKTKFNPDDYKHPIKLRNDLIDSTNGKKVLKIGSKINFVIAKKIYDEGLKNILVSSDYFIDKYIKNNLSNPLTDEIFLKTGSSISKENLDNILELNINTLTIADVDPINKGSYLIDTLNIDKNNSKEEAINDIYKVLRPGEPPSFEVANEIFNNLFFTSMRYDLSDVGRVKLNSKLHLQCSDTITILRNDDIVAIIRHMLDLKDGKGEVDDIDHLGNRRVRSVGELVENQFRIGILRMERVIKEKMSILLEIESAMPQDLINPRPITAAMKDFFATSQLSQFMDQTNPLSEITHKRRVSALGPGGLTRERAGFEVRDVHPTHYGRICPIETPEGPNIGLINSLATYSRVNKYGFIESPYRKVVNSVVTDQIEYLSAIEEEQYTIAQANTNIDKNGNFLEYYEKVIEDLKSKGTNVYFIPGGGSNSIGALGYVECLNEIIKENNKYNFSHIVHATGSAGTQSGLLAGRKYFNCSIPVTGICIRYDKATQENKVYTEAKKVCEKLQCSILDKSEVVVYDEYIGPGYGEPSDDMIEATKLLAKKEAILLDPVYSGKGYAGLIGLIKNKKFTKNDNVLFIHTGGAVSLSAYEWAFNK